MHLLPVVCRPLWTTRLAGATLYHGRIVPAKTMSGMPISRPMIMGSIKFMSTVPQDKTIAAAKSPANLKDRISGWITASKELVVFYKDGLKILWSNSKQAKALRERQAQGHVLTRSEFQLVYQSRKDMIKLVPFGIVFCILPESIPFIVMFAPGMIPSTCIKESQLEAMRKKLNQKRQSMSANVIQSAKALNAIEPADFLSIPAFSRLSKKYQAAFELEQIDRRHLSAYCRFLGLHGWGPAQLLRRRLDRHLEYLYQDDKLLHDEQLVNQLSSAQLRHAVEERGIRSTGASDEQLQRALKYWVALHQIDPPLSRGLIVFSRMFLLNANY